MNRKYLRNEPYSIRARYEKKIKICLRISFSQKWHKVHETEIPNNEQSGQRNRSEFRIFSCQYVSINVASVFSWDPLDDIDAIDLLISDFGLAASLVELTNLMRLFANVDGNLASFCRSFMVSSPALSANTSNGCLTKLNGRVFTYYWCQQTKRNSKSRNYVWMHCELG